MIEQPVIIITAGIILCFGVFSKLSEKSVITSPMICVIAGVIFSFFVTEDQASNIRAPWVKVVAELTLVLVLFVDSSTLDLQTLIKERKLPMRLLLIGLPLTMILGIALAVPLFPDVNIWLLALMALILSPTDAALGLAVVTSESVPLTYRQTINVESGLNDGIALPPILVCLAMLSDPGDTTDVSHWAFFTIKQFVYGPIIGGLVGWLGGRIVEKASQHGWMKDTYQRLASFSIAILAYIFAEMVHGNGFIGAYFAGMLLGTQTKIFRDRIHGFGEAFSQILILVIFLITGLILIPVSYHYWNVASFIYAALSLTVIRMVPVAISLIGSGLDLKTILFIGWFGPRGIASILYLLMAVIAIGVAGHEQILSVVSLTVLMSIFLHGMTAVPFTRIFRNKAVR